MCFCKNPGGGGRIKRKIIQPPFFFECSFTFQAGGHIVPWGGYTKAYVYNRKTKHIKAQKKVEKMEKGET